MTKTFKLAILSCILILSTVMVAGAYDSQNPYLIMPNELKGIEGESIRTDQIFVQKVSHTKVETINGVTIVDDNLKEMKAFPTAPYKALVKRTDNNEVIGFILLTPTKRPNKVAIGSDVTGEFLFYQNSRLFNKLNLAEEGKLYFYQQGKTPNSDSMKVCIGVVEQGVLTYENFMTLKSNTLKMRRDM